MSTVIEEGYSSDSDRSEVSIGSGSSLSLQCSSSSFEDASLHESRIEPYMYDEPEESEEEIHSVVDSGGILFRAYSAYFPLIVGCSHRYPVSSMPSVTTVWFTVFFVS